MDVVGQLQRQFVDYTASLFHEVFSDDGFVHGGGEKRFLDDQFTQLQKLQDENNPEFVFEVVSLFFDDSEKLVNNLAKAFEQQTVEFKQVDAHVHQFKGSSSSIGAFRVKNVCVDFRNFCEQQNIDGCKRCLQQLKHEYSLLKSKLEALFRLERQIIAAGGSIPMME